MLLNAARVLFMRKESSSSSAAALPAVGNTGRWDAVEESVAARSGNTVLTEKTKKTMA